MILTLPASLAYLLTCGSAAVERGSRGREKRWHVCGVSGCGQGKRRSFQRAGTEELGTLLFFPGARERHRQLHRIGERVVEPKGAGRGGRGAHPPPLPPLVVSRRGSLTSSSLSLMSFLRSSIPSICLPSTGPSFLSSSDSVGCGSAFPKASPGTRSPAGSSGPRRPKRRRKGNVTTTVRKKKKKRIAGGKERSGRPISKWFQGELDHCLQRRRIRRPPPQRLLQRLPFVVDSQDRLPDLLRTARPRTRRTAASRPRGSWLAAWR